MRSHGQFARDFRIFPNYLLDGFTVQAVLPRADARRANASRLAENFFEIGVGCGNRLHVERFDEHL
jgi:hypothetical protein